MIRKPPSDESETEWNETGGEATFWYGKTGKGGKDGRGSKGKGKSGDGQSRGPLCWNCNQHGHRAWECTRKGGGKGNSGKGKWGRTYGLDWDETTGDENNQASEQPAGTSNPAPENPNQTQTPVCIFSMDAQCPEAQTNSSTTSSIRPMGLLTGKCRNSISARL